MAGFAIGIVAGIAVAGKVFDATGSYELLLIACAGTSFASALLASFVRPGRYVRLYESEQAAV